MRHFLSLMDWTSDEIKGLLDLAATVKAKPQEYHSALAGQSLAMLFQKPSTRTRVSFEVAMAQLGGHALYLSSTDLQLGRGESVQDTARVLARYVNGVMARVFDHADLEHLTLGGIPVINGLSDRLHPCQALADLLTIREHLGTVEGVTMAYVGDGNNVCHSLIHAAARTGLRLHITTPERFEPDQTIFNAAQSEGADLTFTHDPRAAVAGSDVVYTDVWASMGQESEAAERRKIFEPYQVNGELFSLAASDAIFLHCLPAHRGDEATDEVVDHERSRVFDQAENRMHTEKAVLLTLLAT